MKKVVSLDDITVSELSPNSIYDEYTRLLEVDIQKYFDAKSFSHISCPGCGKETNQDAFQKIGLTYKSCSDCGSLYVSPRPNTAALNVFYGKSAAIRYWQKEISDFEESHLKHIHIPRIHWMINLIDEFSQNPGILCDFQSKYPHFLNTVVSENIFRSVILVESILFDRERLLSKNILLTQSVNSLYGKIGVVTAFETFERVSDVNLFLGSVFDLCHPGGLFFITTATCSGFEYQVLKKDAPNVNPINRMNLLSLESLTNKIKNAGFEILELSTPGRLDAQIVKKTIAANPDLKVDSFWKYIFQNRNTNTLQSLQDFLQLNRLSSHVRIAAQKKSKG